MTWGQSFLRCRTKRERHKLFRLWVEEEHPELQPLLAVLKPEEIDRVIEGTVTRCAAEAVARN